METFISLAASHIHSKGIKGKQFASQKYSNLAFTNDIFFEKNNYTVLFSFLSTHSGESIASSLKFELVMSCVGCWWCHITCECRVLHHNNVEYYFPFHNKKCQFNFHKKKFASSGACVDNFEAGKIINIDDIMETPH